MIVVSAARIYTCMCDTCVLFCFGSCSCCHHTTQLGYTGEPSSSSISGDDKDDDDVVIGGTVLSLRCPLSGCKMKQPAHFLMKHRTGVCVWVGGCQVLGCVVGIDVFVCMCCGCLSCVLSCVDCERCPPVHISHTQTPHTQNGHIISYTGFACFDLDPFLQMVQRSGKWQCPVSMTLSSLHDLRV